MYKNKNKINMVCPKCGKHSLKQIDNNIVCNFCGHKLSQGQETNFRLHNLLREEQKNKKHNY
jgi:ribosomal protein L37AE/L43A